MCSNCAVGQEEAEEISYSDYELMLINIPLYIAEIEKTGLSKKLLDGISILALSSSSVYRLLQQYPDASKEIKTDIIEDLLLCLEDSYWEV